MEICMFQKMQHLPYEIATLNAKRGWQGSRRGLPKDLMDNISCGLQGEMLICYSFTCSFSFSVVSGMFRKYNAPMRNRHFSKGSIAPKSYVSRNEMLIGNSFTCPCSFCRILYFQKMQHLPRETATVEGQWRLTRVLEGSAKGPEGHQIMCFAL
jgi:hypothetical protein